MNIYRITYIAGEGESEEAFITERTEAAARKAFSANHKGCEITDVELVDVDAPATKGQEREALEKIKALVAELGPNSYLKTAFKGCFEIAEQNIEYDFGDSLEGQVEIAEGRAKELEDELNRTHQRVLELERELNGTQAQIAALTKRQLCEELRRDLWVMVTEEAEVSRARMAKAAHMMAVCADNPACVGFQESVADYRKEEKRAEAMEKRAAALDAMEPKKD